MLSNRHVWSEERKGFELKESCEDKRDERKFTLWNLGFISQGKPTDEASRKRYNLTKPGHSADLGTSATETCLLVACQALLRRHSLPRCAGTFIRAYLRDTGNLLLMIKGKHKCKSEAITKAARGGGWIRSSGEAPVMGADRVPPKALAVAQRRDSIIQFSNY